MKYERHLLSTLREELSKPTPVIHVLIGPLPRGKKQRWPVSGRR
jgi:hypothetical protein